MDYIVFVICEYSSIKSTNNFDLILSYMHTVVWPFCPVFKKQKIDFEKQLKDTLLYIV